MGANELTEPAEIVKPLIRKVVEQESLSRSEAESAMDAIMEGGATPAQVAALVTALRMKGESIDEIAGFAAAMRRHALPVELPRGKPVVDTCGTGGDNSGTFNISTTAAFVIAGAGAVVAKHGNRAVTSQCGSADLLEGLGVRIDLSPSEVTHCLKKARIGFMFAQQFHPGFRHAGPVRREIGIRSIFNILGPLTNPAGVRRQLIGVGSEQIAPKMAEALAQIGCDHVLVVHAGEGLDEISISGPTNVTEYNGKSMRQYQIEPKDAGLPSHPPAAIRGGDSFRNVDITQQVLAGKSGAPRDVVLINAAAGLIAAGIASDIRDGVTRAAESIDSGAAQAALEALVKASNRAVVAGA